ncbi:hypothetical protein PAT3040_01640 [Paenibacillus agaridevorans]|uniref:Uncharacterized protein n=2 Tax=Paenibacillus agaridevorans TaxID=171404 RepID=A0A2R5EKE9_9BACL|nr:hypothetical protein PAT3040_01640 [Paenibacillus agaridevorans]
MVSHTYAGDDPCYGLDHCFISTNETGTTATLEWEPIEGVQSYSLKITIPFNYDDTDEVVLEEELDIDDLLFDSEKNRYIYNLTGLKSGTLHYALLKYGEGDWDWSPLYFTTLTSVEPPANVEVIDITETSATVQWMDNPGHSEYYISWGPELSTYVRDGSGSYTIENLTSNTTYTVSIYALVGTTLTSEPVEISFTTTEAAIVWPTEVNFEAEDITHRTATLIWDEVQGATEYHLSNGDGWEATVTDAAYQLTGLTPSTSYTYKLTASNGTSTSQEFTHTFTTAIAAVDHETIKVDMLTHDSIKLTFDAVDGAEKYAFEGARFYSDKGTSIHINSLAHQTSYTIKLYAVHPGGIKSAPTLFTFTTLAPPLPGDANLSSLDFRVEYQEGLNVTLGWTAWIPDASSYELIIDGGEPEYFAREDMHWYAFHHRFTKSLAFRQNGTHTASLRGVNMTGKSKAYELTFTVAAREANPTQSVVPVSKVGETLNGLENVINNLNNTLSNGTWRTLPEGMKLDIMNSIMSIVNEGYNEVGKVIFTSQVEGNIAKATVSAADVALAAAESKDYVDQANKHLNKLGANPVKPAVVLDFEDVTLQSSEITLDASAMKTLLDAGVESVTIKLNGTQVSINPKEFPNGFELNRGQQSAPKNASNGSPNFVSDIHSFEFTDNNGVHSTFNNPVGVSLPTRGLGNVDTALLTVVNVSETSSEQGDEPTTIIGNFGGTFNPATGTVDTVLHGFSSYAVIENKVNFNDMGSVKWAERSIQVAAAKGIVVGDGKGNYNPTGDVTRAEFLKMLVTTFHLKAPKATEPFIDVNDSDWFSPYVKAGLNSGIIDSSTAFNPRAAITREEMAQMIGRVLRNQPGAFEIANTDEILKDFPDAASISSNIKDDLAFTVLKGIMVGKDNGFEPTAKTTRAEAAVIVKRLIDLK